METKFNMNSTTITNNVRCHTVIDEANLNIHYEYSLNTAPASMHVDINKNQDGVCVNINRDYKADGTYTPIQTFKPLGDGFETILSNMMINVFANYQDPTNVEPVIA